MTIDDYKAAAIAIGRVASAKDLVEQAQDAVEYAFDGNFAKDFNRVWATLNNIVAELNEELDCTTLEDKQ